MKLLLHACCGPCSLEPTRLLSEQGHDITIAYMNANIQPRSEYDRRWEALLAWARSQGIPVVAGVYDETAWSQGPGRVYRAKGTRADRCRACYRMRLEEAAVYAQAQGFDGISTTLAVSPYQLSAICHEELQAAAQRHGLAFVWQDFRPNYPETTRRSRELGMYRQNYCGCLVSKEEAQAQRRERKQKKAAQAAARRAAEAPLREAQRQKRAAYEARQRAKREAKHRIRVRLKAESDAKAHPWGCQEITDQTEQETQ